MTVTESYSVQMVFCIDCTGSMGSFLDNVKENAKQIYADIQEKMQSFGKQIDSMRVKICAFRDYYSTGDRRIAESDPRYVMHESDFFDLPAQNEELQGFIDKLTPVGGGAAPESSLEAIALAMKSDWQEFKGKHRQVIVLWTDSLAHPLEKRETTETIIPYPEMMPKDLNELTDWWDGQDSKFDFTGKRLIMFAPALYPWPEISENWNNTILTNTQAGAGITDVGYKDIITVISKSL